jgi:Uncharacterized protein conserved in bacteria (DUF2252)
VRQFRNMKGSVALDAIDPGALADYAEICGQLLAKGHARTSGASMIAGYLGRSDKVDRPCARSPAHTPTRPSKTTSGSSTQWRGAPSPVSRTCEAAR